ncbi:hypothetical protein B566_EDAN014024 [Ephemera danica]|nr:hypothetical protein B566_EDAN014024 [Ephemera danica]
MGAMSSFDVVMQKFIGNFGFWLIVLTIVFFILKRWFSRYRDRFFAKFESAFADVYNGPSRITKEKLFAPIQEIVSADWRLKNEGAIRILEIGAGNGANLKYFPKGSRLVFVDKNAAFEPLLRDNLRLHTSLRLERIVHCNAEDMHEVADESVDAVVCSLVLCSVSDVPRVLAEVRRVLAPHVLAKPGTTLNKVQRVLSQSRIWPTLFLGCRLDKETGKEVKRAGFSDVDLKDLEVYSESHIAFKLIRAHVAGVATK